MVLEKAKDQQDDNGWQSQYYSTHLPRTHVTREKSRVLWEWTRSAVGDILRALHGSVSTNGHRKQEWAWQAWWIQGGAPTPRRVSPWKLDIASQTGSHSGPAPDVRNSSSLDRRLHMQGDGEGVSSDRW